MYVLSAHVDHCVVACFPLHNKHNKSTKWHMCHSCSSDLPPNGRVIHLPSFYSRKITGSAFTQCLTPQPINSIYIDESRIQPCHEWCRSWGRPRGEPCTVRWYSNGVLQVQNSEVGNDSRIKSIIFFHHQGNRRHTFTLYYWSFVGNHFIFVICLTYSIIIFFTFSAIVYKSKIISLTHSKVVWIITLASI